MYFFDEEPHSELSDTATAIEPAPEPIKLGDPELSDVTLIVDQQEFHANKMVLANRSDVFKAMFCGKFKEAEADRVEIKNVTVDDFRRLLELIYTGSISDGDEFLAVQRDFDTVTTDYSSYGDCVEIVVHGVDKIMSGNNDIKDEHKSNLAVVVHVWQENKTAQKQHIVNFWKFVGGLLVAADRFNLEKVVLDYLQHAISKDFCCCNMCEVCLNYWIFAEEHGLDVPQKHRTFIRDTLDRWFEAVSTAPSCKGPIEYAVMEKILKKTGKI